MKKWWVVLGLIVLTGALVFFGKLLHGARSEVVYGQFSLSLIPTLETYLKETGEYDKEHIKPGPIGIYAYGAQDFNPETSCTVIAGKSVVIVVPEEVPSNSSVPCLWYDKISGKHSRFILSPWK